MTSSFSIASCRSGIERSLERGPPTLDRVAEAMGTSTRTLQRHLQQAGVRFSALRDEVRLERSRRLLAHSHMRIADIATEVGFTQPSSFSRSFLRWTGLSPRAYRLGVRGTGRGASVAGHGCGDGAAPRRLVTLASSGAPGGRDL